MKKKSDFILIPLCFSMFLLTFPLRAQIITTIAGNGIRGYFGEGVPATAAEINGVPYITLDSFGNIYLSDQQNERIRRINASGIIATIAGTGSVGFSGDGIPATTANISHPWGLATDGYGSVYFSDDNNYRVRKIDPTGFISTIAGNGVPGFLGDGGAATIAKFNQVIGLLMDGKGNLLVADNGNGRVRKISPATGGIVTTIAGGGSGGGFSGDGGPASAAGLYQPSDIALDGTGNLYIADEGNNRVRKVDVSGTINTFAGNGTAGYSGDGLPATAAELNNPWGVAVDGCGNVYIADLGNYRIRKVDIFGTITTIAGNGTPAFGGDGGPATASSLSFAYGVKTDRKGNIFIADNSNYRVRMIATTNRAPSFVSGHIQSIILCSDSVVTVNAMLSVIDSDANQGETWSVGTAPTHGTLTGSYVTISTGGTLTPWGLSYTPGGYIGADSFKVVVTDCDDMLDTTTVYVTAKACPLSVLTTRNNSIDIFPNPVTNSLTIVAKETIHKVVITNIAGQTMYSHECGSEQVHVDVAALPKGMYVVKVNGSNERGFVKE